MQVKFVTIGQLELELGEGQPVLERVKRVPEQVARRTGEPTQKQALLALLKQSINHHCPNVDLADPYSISAISAALGTKVRFVSTEQVQQAAEYYAQEQGVGPDQLELVTCEVLDRDSIVLTLVDDIDIENTLLSMGHELVHVLLHGCIDFDRPDDPDCFSPEHLGKHRIFAIEPVRLTRSVDQVFVAEESEADREATDLARLLLLPQELVELGVTLRGDQESVLTFLELRSPLSRSQIQEELARREGVELQAT